MRVRVRGGVGPQNGVSTARMSAFNSDSYDAVLVEASGAGNTGSSLADSSAFAAAHGGVLDDSSEAALIDASRVELETPLGRGAHGYVVFAAVATVVASGRREGDGARSSLRLTRTLLTRGVVCRTVRFGALDTAESVSQLKYRTRVRL